MLTGLLFLQESNLQMLIKVLKYLSHSPTQKWATSRRFSAESLIPRVAPPLPGLRVALETSFSFASARRSHHRELAVVL